MAHPKTVGIIDSLLFLDKNMAAANTWYSACGFQWFAKVCGSQKKSV